MIIGIDCGHTLAGADTGAIGQGFKEQDKTREIGNALINKLNSLGHTVINCTVDSASTVSESLSNRVNIANKNNLDLFISIHLNAFNKEARGFEVHIAPTHSPKSLEYANSIKTEICKLGYVDRGVKVSNLYVLNNTKAPAVYLECGFIDNREDMALYNVDKITNAILEGLNLKPLTEDNRSNETVVVNNTTTKDNWIARLQAECNKQGFSNQIVDGVQGENTLKGCPLVREGAQGNITRLLQEKLISLGYNCGGYGADGKWGSGTTNSVKTFQRDFGLIMDGIVGRGTWGKLIGL